MSERNKKIATTMVELLILLAIVGILSVMYQKVVKRDTITTKYAYLQVLKNMVNFAATETKANGNLNPLDATICHRFYHSLNTLGEKNCDGSLVPDIANVTTINGMRFFGLNGDFENTHHDPNPENSGFGYKFISVDLDGVAGANTIGKDILNFELTQNGHIRPTGAVVIDTNNNRTTLRGNVARDPELFSIGAYCVGRCCNPASTYCTSNSAYAAHNNQCGDTGYYNAHRDECEYKNNMGNRLSYLEAQCLTGNPFPYRATDNNGEIQMCIKDESATVYNAVNNNDPNLESVLKAYWQGILGIDGANSAAPANSTICDTLYTSENSGAYGLVSMNDTVKSYCRACYRAAYKAKYCKNVLSATGECPTAVLQEKSSCITSDYVEN